MVLLISYDLNGHERPSRYARVKKYIEEHSTASIRPLYSQWFVETTSTPQQLSDALIDNGLIDQNDQLFIHTINRGQHQGWLRKPEWEWLNARL